MSVREMEGTGVGDRVGLSTIPPTKADSRQGTYSVATSTRSAARSSWLQSGCCWSARG
jgi:hypothetical protein